MLAKLGDRRRRNEHPVDDVKGAVVSGEVSSRHSGLAAVQHDVAAVALKRDGLAKQCVQFASSSKLVDRDSAGLSERVGAKHLVE